MEEILRLQQNLLLLRRTVGWTADEFGERIGVTRQTINNIENGRNRLTKTQYIAIRSVLEAEIIQNPLETEMLKVLLDVLVDEPDKYSDEDAETLVMKANMLAPAILAGTASRKDVSSEWIKYTKDMASAGIITALLSSVVSVGGLVAVSAWLTKIATVVKTPKK